MVFTQFRSLTGTIGTPVEYTRAELKQAIAGATPAADRKQDLPMICVASFRDDHATQANHIASSCIALDFDKPVPDPDLFLNRVWEALSRRELFAHSSFSSAPNAWKLRVFVPLDEPTGAVEFGYCWDLVAWLLRVAEIDFDESTKNFAQRYFTWAIPPNGVYWHSWLDGGAWPVSQSVDLGLQRAAAEAEARSRAKPAPIHWGRRSTIDVAERARRYVAKMPPAISKQRGHDPTWAVARKLIADFELTEEQAWPIMLEYNERCKPPWTAAELRHKLRSATTGARVRVPMGGAT